MQNIVLTVVMKDVLYVEMKITSDTFLGYPETGKYWKIETEFLNKTFLNVDEDLAYKKILTENIHIYFSKGYLKLMYSFQTYWVHFVGECD